MGERKERCDAMYCREPATHVMRWESDAGGERTALRCDYCARPEDEPLADDGADDAKEGT